MCFKKDKFDIVGHPECSHNWIHNAGQQCGWDRESKFPYESEIADSKNVCNMYICTMCGGQYWSFNKDQNIPHYRVRGVRR